MYFVMFDHLDKTARVIKESHEACLLASQGLAFLAKDENADNLGKYATGRNSILCQKHDCLVYTETQLVCHL